MREKGCLITKLQRWVLNKPPCVKVIMSEVEQYLLAPGCLVSRCS